MPAFGVGEASPTSVDVGNAGALAGVQAVKTQTRMAVTLTARCFDLSLMDTILFQRTLLQGLSITRKRNSNTRCRMFEMGRVL